MSLVCGSALCALFPTSRSVDDLADPFRGRVRAFLDALHARGCTVRISATRRPRPRAWLMRQAWDVAHGIVASNAVPAFVPGPGEQPMPEILWSVEGARAMVETYELVVQPATNSRHNTGRAIDMTIEGWPATPANLEDPENLGSLYLLGRGYGVIKLVKDRPHWSDDGH